MKFLVDANLSPEWVTYLREFGFEADHWYSLGAQNAPDIEIMAYAAKHGYVVLTRDLDFGTILAELEAVRPSVIQLRANPSEPHYVGPQVVNALKELAEPLRSGALLTVDPKRTRARLLPFRIEDM